ncbi:hypothetical protein HYV44_02310 [Candidatus Microgenomates bacterium]|nr:hypothetical protein [Candidatus Microgenomates bacterium]
MLKIWKKIARFFDRFEDRNRHLLSRYPLLYAMVGGVGVVLFYRGIWMLADDFFISSWASIFLALVILMSIGLLISSFVGDKIIMSGLKRQHKISLATEKEESEELQRIKNIEKKLNKLLTKKR